MSSVKKNFLYNAVYQLLILICPLVITPYLSRVIGAGGIGVYSYVYSIVYYFMLFTLLGVNNYGNRTIAKERDDKEKLSKAFWEIYIMQLIMGGVLLFLYILGIMLLEIENKTIFLLGSIFILSSILDINWLFFGLEEFKKTVTRNMIVKVLSVVLVFIFVKSDSDVWKYMGIMAGSTVVSQLVMWFFLKGKIIKTSIKPRDVVKHVRPNLTLFIPVIAVSLYKIMDKVMLGALTNANEVGFYDNAEKIVTVPIIIVTALGTVMMPRVANIIKKGKTDYAKRYMDKSISFIMFIILAMSFGLVSISNNFTPLFFGDGFEKTSVLIILLSITLPFISFANVIRTQYLIPFEKDGIYVKSVFLGAVVNLLMNAMFIPHFRSIGACFGTIAAEIIVMVYQAFMVRKEIPIRKYLAQSIQFLLKAMLMLAIIYPFNLVAMNDWLRIGIQIILGGGTYCLLNIRYIKMNINLKRMLRRKTNLELPVER